MINWQRNKQRNQQQKTTTKEKKSPPSRQLPRNVLLFPGVSTWYKEEENKEEEEEEEEAQQEEQEQELKEVIHTVDANFGLQLCSAQVVGLWGGRIWMTALRRWHARSTRDGSCWPVPGANHWLKQQTENGVYHLKSAIVPHITTEPWNAIDLIGSMVFTLWLTVTVTATEL